MCFFFVSLMYILGVIPSFSIPFLPAPIVLQSMGVFLMASLIGVYASLSMLVFLVLIAIGFPLLPGARGGYEVFIGPMAGYLAGYMFAALIIGLLTKVYWKRYTFFLAVFFNMIGVLVIYIMGITVFIIITGTGIAHAILENLIFVPGDIIKVIFVSIIAIQVKRYYPLINSNVVDNTVR